jgi:NAD(P)-dependent dehydrogenase (short-subunit alcohol dehydrogenase family)
MRFQGKVAVVTGGGSGISAAAAASAIGKSCRSGGNGVKIVRH